MSSDEININSINPATIQHQEVLHLHPTNPQKVILNNLNKTVVEERSGLLAELKLRPNLLAAVLSNQELFDALVANKGFLSTFLSSAALQSVIITNPSLLRLIVNNPSLLQLIINNPDILYLIKPEINQINEKQLLNPTSNAKTGESIFLSLMRKELTLLPYAEGQLHSEVMRAKLLNKIENSSPLNMQLKDPVTVYPQKIQPPEEKLVANKSNIAQPPIDAKIFFNDLSQSIKQFFQLDQQPVVSSKWFNNLKNITNPVLVAILGSIANIANPVKGMRPDEASHEVDKSAIYDSDSEEGIGEISEVTKIVEPLPPNLTDY